MPKKPVAQKPVTPRFKKVRRTRNFFLEWRKYRKMTLEEAAPLAGMTAGNLSAIERGVQGYTEEAMEGLCKAYKTSPGWLLDYNPLADGPDGIGPVWDKADESQKKTIVEIAKTIVKTGT